MSLEVEDDGKASFILAKRVTGLTTGTCPVTTGWGDEENEKN